jgi:hypothetical protein
MPVNDAVILMRDIAGDAAMKAANKVNPSEDELAQIDRPADDNTWHDVPDMSAGNIKQQIRSQYSQQKPLSRDDVRDAAGNASQAAHPDGSRDPTDTAAIAGQDQRYGTSSGVDAQSGLQNGAATLKQRASENIDEDTKQKGRETRERTKNYLSKKMPEERRGQVIWRLKKLVIECQGHPDCKSLEQFVKNFANRLQISKLLPPFLIWRSNMLLTPTLLATTQLVPLRVPMQTPLFKRLRLIFVS